MAAHADNFVTRSISFAIELTTHLRFEALSKRHVTSANEAVSSHTKLYYYMAISCHATGVRTIAENRKSIEFLACECPSVTFMSFGETAPTETNVTRLHHWKAYYFIQLKPTSRTAIRTLPLDKLFTHIFWEKTFAFWKAPHRQRYGSHSASTVRASEESWLASTAKFTGGFPTIITASSPYKGLRLLWDIIREVSGRHSVCVC